ncbi:sensor histidine kinase [Actinomadura livida]|uniref:histidine kinase n=1 Tax=Actinomadura livida TaxID=79909 RepID=A0A7W7MWR4_9ACTN|nr:MULTISPECIES: sensor histidine kinase [Actinomadura]MBB4773122.1 signal transduction histidine kinase [Actinomadura catellatispora]GGU18131.1 two-component sensor histidine kinase [Actinomadura livida]
MSTSPPHGPARPTLPRPGLWPVWVVPAFLAFFQIFGSLGAQHGGGQPGGGTGGGSPGPPWAEGGGPGAGLTELDALGFGLLLAGPALLLLRRRHPVLVLAATAAVTVLYLLRAYTYGPVIFSMAVAMFAAVVAGHRLAAWAGTGAVLAAYFALTTVIGVSADERGSGGLFPVERPSLVAMTFVTAWALVVLVTAELVRMRGQRAAEAARIRAEKERRQASEERLRMARELHDVLAHNISMINVQAGVALHLLDENPEQARTALAAIKDASKEALTEMRGVIGALRAQGETAPRSPTAGLDGLADLAARARSAGLAVEVEITGDRRPLHASTDLAAFRIVQESLTNVTRHAGPGPVTARVAIAYREHEIVVRVEDDGQGVSLLDDHPAGSGIRGMRERAAALGGGFDAGPRPGGGFRVQARLPLTGEPDGAPPDTAAPGKGTQ